MVSWFEGLRLLASFYFTIFNTLLPSCSLRKLLSWVGLLRKQTLSQRSADRCSSAQGSWDKPSCKGVMKAGPGKGRS